MNINETLYVCKFYSVMVSEILKRSIRKQINKNIWRINKDVLECYRLIELTFFNEKAGIPLGVLYVFYTVVVDI